MQAQLTQINPQSSSEVLSEVTTDQAPTNRVASMPKQECYHSIHQVVPQIGSFDIMMLQENFHLHLQKVREGR